MSNLPSSYFVKQSLLFLSILLLRIYLLPFMLSFMNFKIFFERMAPMVSHLLEGLSTKLIVPGASLPNRPTYRTNPIETKEIDTQVNELLDKGWVQKSLSPCVVPVLLVPKKDGKWRMCCDCRAINNITIK